LEIMGELVPHASVIGCLVNPNFPGVADQLAELERAAQTAGRRLRILNASTKHEINVGFRTLANGQVDALLVGPGPFFTAHREQIIALADSYAIPSIYTERVWPKAGGLMSIRPVPRMLIVRLASMPGALPRANRQPIYRSS